MNHILLIEDDNNHRFLVQRILERAGYIVKALPNGEEIELVLSKQVPHLILVDLLLPYPDGLEIARIIRKNNDFSSIPIVAITASAFGDVEEACDKAGINGIINKPVNGQELLEQVADYIN